MTDGPVESMSVPGQFFLQRHLGSEQTQKQTGIEQWKLQGTAKALGFLSGTGARARQNSFQVVYQPFLFGRTVEKSKTAGATLVPDAVYCHTS